MPLDYATLDALRSRHPAWRLLNSPHAPLVASFLHNTFVTPNLRVMAEADLAEKLEDELYALREAGVADFPKRAAEYLNDWAAQDKAWLRKFYLPGSDEAQFDLTPATEKALHWLNQLAERQFIGTESRLLTLFNLLKQMHQGSETDPEKRLAELHRKRAEIDAEIDRVQAGELTLLDDTALKDRFQQFTSGARELLADFREVEHNFRQLDRRVRERIALWEGSKGALLEQIMGERDAIADSDQGKSFRAFWDFLLSARRQEELAELLDQVLTLPAIAAMVQDNPADLRLKRVHYDWIGAGEHTQRTVAQLSQQLRRFLDDQAWLENRRIMEILQHIEVHALVLRDAPPKDWAMPLDLPFAEIDLPLERPLFTPSVKASLIDEAPPSTDEQVDAHALFDQVVVDKERLILNIQRALQHKKQVSLKELIATQALQHGLAELTAYLQVGVDLFDAVIDETVHERHEWQVSHEDGSTHTRSAIVPRVLFNH